MGYGAELFIDFTFSRSISVMVSRDDTFKHFVSISSSHYVSRFLPQVVYECLESSKENFSSLSGIYIAKGPGSFTALRILISYIKGIHAATSTPIYAYNSTDWMAYYILRAKAKVRSPFSIGFYSGAKNFYYFAEYEVEDDVPVLRRTGIVEGEGKTDFSDSDIEKEIGAKYMFYLHLVKKPEVADVAKLQPNYIFQEVLQISQKKERV